MPFAKGILIILLLLLAQRAAGSEEPVFQTDLSFILDHSKIASGGLEQSTVSRWLLEAGMTLDLERATGIPGAELFAAVQVQRGANGSDFAGDIQGFSNIDAENFEQFGEIGFSQSLKEGQWQYKFGRLDANSDFAIVETAGEFLNSSAGYTPPIHTFPSYPDPVWAANLSVQPADWFSVGAGIYESLLEDGQNHDTVGLFTILETRVSWNDAGRLVLGAWKDHGMLTRFDGDVRHSHDGYYGILEQRLSPGLDLFLQAGSADEAVAEITSHYAAGLAATGLIPSRPDDTAGIMATQAGLNGLNGFQEDEIALELFYGIRTCNRFVLKPDLQYIIHPSGDPAIEDTFVVTLRLEFGF
jgi:porin